MAWVYWQQLPSGVIKIELGQQLTNIFKIDEPGDCYSINRLVYRRCNRLLSNIYMTNPFSGFRFPPCMPLYPALISISVSGWGATLALAPNSAKAWLLLPTWSWWCDPGASQKKKVKWNPCSLFNLPFSWHLGAGSHTAMMMGGSDGTVAIWCIERSNRTQILWRLMLAEWNWTAQM